MVAMLHLLHSDTAFLLSVTVLSLYDVAGKKSFDLSGHPLLTWQSYPIIYPFNTTDELKFQVG